MRLDEISMEFYGQAKCKMGTRDPEDVRWVVIHDTEGSSARSGAYTLTTRTDGSAHECLDADACYYIGNWRTILCGTGGFNTPTYHIEQPGKAAWKRSDWLIRKRQLVRLAYRVAYHLVRRGLPNRYCLADDLKAGRKGYTTHLQVTLSGLGTTTHTDPGRRFPFEGKLGEKLLITYFVRRFKERGLPEIKVVA